MNDMAYQLSFILLIAVQMAFWFVILPFTVAWIIILIIQIIKNQIK